MKFVCKSATALVALGTNLPHDGLSGAALLTRAVEALRLAGLPPVALSGVWETPAWPPSDQPNYFNAVVEVGSAGLTPEALYRTLRTLEARFGRDQRERWGPRTLDLDIIAMDGFVGVFGPITLPHKRMHERRFVLAPLAEIASDWRHPGLKTAVSELLAALPPSPARWVGPLEMLPQKD
jgi:2-amino-4-hydroxy-6-hydroxymethyldihydropteridine diphosphokinase